MHDLTDNYSSFLFAKFQPVFTLSSSLTDAACRRGRGGFNPLCWREFIILLKLPPYSLKLLLRSVSTVTVMRSDKYCASINLHPPVASLS